MKLFTVEHKEKLLSFLLPANQDYPQDKSFNQFLEKVRIEDLVVISRSSNQINEIGIVGRHSKSESLYLKQGSRYEFFISWYQMNEIILPPECALKSEEYIIYFSQIFEFILSLKSSFHQLPQEVMLICAKIIKEVERYKNRTWRQEPSSIGKPLHTLSISLVAECALIFLLFLQLKSLEV